MHGAVTLKGEGRTLAASGTLLTPAAFLDQFVHARQPVILRGAAKMAKAQTTWSDTRLTAVYGDLRVKLEPKRENNGVVLGGEGGLGRASIRTFLNSLQHRDAYVVSQLPTPMHADVVLPSCLECPTIKGKGASF
jgi:hypothetical protein